MTFKILRFEPLQDEYPHFQLYRYDPRPHDTDLEALKEIRDHQDPSLSFRYSCREAVCGSCGMVMGIGYELVAYHESTNVGGISIDDLVADVTVDIFCVTPGSAPTGGGASPVYGDMTGGLK